MIIKKSIFRFHKSKIKILFTAVLTPNQVLSRTFLLDDVYDRLDEKVVSAYFVVFESAIDSNPLRPLLFVTEQ